MQCPFCGSTKHRVLDSREAADAIRRRRECEACEERFTTYERVQALRMHVVKRNGRRELFDRDKLLRGLQRAAAKRPIEPERLDELVDSIEAVVRRRGGEAPAESVGELALGGLARLDRVAAVRFASVYRSIEDLSAFEAELRRLESEPVAGPDQLEIDVLQDEAVPSAQESILATPSGGRSKPRRTPRNNQNQRRGHASHP
ncbi:MAG: transcriptional repressor NrdR [Solirubrobacteraceae bacterium]|nr:transcriptional repressor NrdR [Solirubrobacteraceae bacterium]